MTTNGNGSLLGTPVLVLNATYEPIHVCAARRALILLLKGVAAAEELTALQIRSTTRAVDLPSVIRSLQGQALSSAHVVTARFHIRAGRYQAAARHLRSAASLNPRTLLSRRAGRLLVNACVNRVGHWILWSLRRSHQ